MKFYNRQYLLMTVQVADLVSNVCPGKKGEKALVMENMEANAGSQEAFDFGREIEVKPEVVAKFKPDNSKRKSVQAATA